MTEQCIFCSGRPPRYVGDVLVGDLRAASSSVLPLIISVRADEEAMALAQPKVLNLASSIRPVARRA